MFRKVSVIIGTMATAAILSVASLAPANAAEGCGYGWWRGPWGHCRHTAYFGNLPGGGYSAQPDCPSGYWIGPWGHCRDTPYHGRLPGGDYR